METTIDRRSLVRRHNPTRTAGNPMSPLQVGNGRFAFGADITGLQTVVPFATMAEWGWKTDPLPPGADMARFRGQSWQTAGRQVPYDMPDPDDPATSRWLVSNPNRMNLARVGLSFPGQHVAEADFESASQTLDLWTGTIDSALTWEGHRISVQTAVHPDRDALGVGIDSLLVRQGRLSVFLDFPYNDGRSKFSAPYTGYWDEPDRHHTALEQGEGDVRHACIRHRLDDTTYTVLLQWNLPGRFRHVAGHRYAFEVSSSAAAAAAGAGTTFPSPPSSSSSSSGPVLHLSATFGSGDEVSDSPSAPEIAEASAKHWPSFWNSGGAIDLSASSDPRWRELERRIILSQYVMAVNAAGGDYPPQESGLVNLGWYGKFHMEMTWWHWAHLALFNRWSLLYPGLDIYRRFLPSAVERAACQGYRGARWPKMTDPSGRMAPGEINALLVWQQPHPLAFAELDYRAHPSPATLEWWRGVVGATADFMASYATWNETAGTFDLGPPMHTVSENTVPRQTRNPSFDLEYWRLGLDIALRWWQRLGLAAPATWTRVMRGLAPPPTEGGTYVIHQGIEDMWNRYNWEHPALAGLYGWLPGTGSLDMATMRATAERIWATWHLDDCWGWDFGVLAMNAARLGEPSRAVDFLLDPNMPFDDMGFEPGGNRVPFPYLPSAGSLLYSAAFMAAGWDGAPDGLHAPGFPSQGWVVKHEGLSKAL